MSAPFSKNATLELRQAPSGSGLQGSKSAPSSAAAPSQSQSEPTMSSQIPMTGIPARQPAQGSMPPPSFRSHSASSKQAAASAQSLTASDHQPHAATDNHTQQLQGSTSSSVSSGQISSTESQQVARLRAELEAAVQRSKQLEGKLASTEAQLGDQVMLMHTAIAEAQQREQALKQTAEKAKQRQESSERYQQQQVVEADRAAQGAKRARDNLEKALRTRIAALEDDMKRLRRASGGGGSLPPAHTSQPRSGSRSSQGQATQQPPLLTSSGGVRARRPPSASGFSPSPDADPVGTLSSQSQPAAPVRQWAHLEQLEASARGSAPAASGGTPTIIAPSAVRAVSAPARGAAASPPPTHNPVQGGGAGGSGTQRSTAASAIQTAVQTAVAHCAPQMLLLLSAADGAASLAAQLRATQYSPQEHTDVETATNLPDAMLSDDGRSAPYEHQHGNMHLARWLQLVCTTQAASRVDTAFLERGAYAPHDDGGEPLWRPSCPAGGSSEPDAAQALARLTQPCVQIQNLVASAESAGDPQEAIHSLLSCLIALIHLPPTCSALGTATRAVSCLQAAVSVAAAQVLCVICCRSDGIMAELLAQPLAQLASVSSAGASPVPPAPAGWDDSRPVPPPAASRKTRRRAARTAVRSDGSEYEAASSALSSAVASSAASSLPLPHPTSGSGQSHVSLWEQLLSSAPREHAQHLQAFSACSVAVVSAWLQVVSHLLRRLRRHADALHAAPLYILGKAHPSTTAGHGRALAHGLENVLVDVLSAPHGCPHLPAILTHFELARCLAPTEQQAAIAHSSHQAPPAQVQAAIYSPSADTSVDSAAGEGDSASAGGDGQGHFAPPAWWRVGMLRSAGLPALSALARSVDALSPTLALRLVYSGRAADACFSNFCGAASAWLGSVLPSPVQLMDSADALPFLRTTWAVWNDSRTQPSHRDAQLVPVTPDGSPPAHRRADSRPRSDAASGPHEPASRLHRVEPSSCLEVPLAGVSKPVAHLVASLQHVLRCQPAGTFPATRALASLHGLSGTDFHTLAVPDMGSLPGGTLGVALPHAARLCPRLAWLVSWGAHTADAAATHGHDLMVDATTSHTPVRHAGDLSLFAPPVRAAWELVVSAASEGSRVLAAANTVLGTVAALVPEALLSRLQQSHSDLALMAALAQMDVWGGERGFIDCGGGLSPNALHARHAPSPEGAFDVHAAATKLFKLPAAGASQSDAPLRSREGLPAESAPQAVGGAADDARVPMFTPTSIRDDIGHMGWVAVGAGLPDLLRLRARYNADLRSAVKGGSA